MMTRVSGQRRVRNVTVGDEYADPYGEGRIKIIQ